MGNRKLERRFLCRVVLADAVGTVVMRAEDEAMSKAEWLKEKTINDSVSAVAEHWECVLLSDEPDVKDSSERLLDTMQGAADARLLLSLDNEGHQIIAMHIKEDNLMLDVFEEFDRCVKFSDEISDYRKGLFAGLSVACEKLTPDADLADIADTCHDLDLSFLYAERQEH